MISSERETYLLTLSPLPSGDILNSSKTLTSSLLFVTVHHSGERLRLSLPARLGSRSFIEPDFRILHLAVKPKPVQRFAQHRAALLHIGLIALRLFAQLAEPLDKRDKLRIEDALEIFLHESRQGRCHPAGADRDARMARFDDRGHVDRGGLG